METWPTECPQFFDAGSYTYAPGENRVMSETDAGPGKQRQRFTSVPVYHTGTMLMSLSEFSYFQLFVANDIGYADKFYFPNPLDSGATDIIVRFSPKNTPVYSVRDSKAPGYVTVSFSLMETLA